MAKNKNLLTESQVRQFMKLAKLGPLSPNFIGELRTGRTGALGPKGGTANAGHGRGQGEAADGSLYEEEDPAELEGDIAHDLGDDSLEGDEEAAADELEIDAELAPAEGGDDRSISVDDFLSALETALESVLGDEVEIDADDMADDEVEADVEVDAEMDMGGEEVAVDDEEELPLEERQKYGGNKGDIPDADRPKEEESGKPGGASKEDVEERGEKLNKESTEADDELVEQITKRVAARILKTALANK